AGEGRGAAVRRHGGRARDEGRDAADAREGRRGRSADPRSDRRSVPRRPPRRDGLLSAQQRQGRHGDARRHRPDRRQRRHVAAAGLGHAAAAVNLPHDPLEALNWAWNHSEGAWWLVGLIGAGIAWTSKRMRDWQRRNTLELNRAKLGGTPWTGATADATASPAQPAPQPAKASSYTAA